MILKHLQVKIFERTQVEKKERRRVGNNKCKREES